MNYAKMLAALMVATMSLTVAPVASATHSCPANDSPLPSAIPWNGISPMSGALNSEAGEQRLVYVLDPDALVDDKDLVIQSAANGAEFRVLTVGGTPADCTESQGFGTDPFENVQSDTTYYIEVRLKASETASDFTLRLE